MFTGIVQTVGEVRRVESRGVDSRLHVEASAPALVTTVVGDSIAVNGCCLTAVTVDGQRFTADVSAESLARTTLGSLESGSHVNLETALTLSTPLGGHLVSGHVDGVGDVVSRCDEGRAQRWRFRAPDRLARYIAEKGSICIDGISLTVNLVAGSEFEVMIVPHTAEATTIGTYGPARQVNIEVDLVARYLERLLTSGTDAGEQGGVTRSLLARAGFL